MGAFSGGRGIVMEQVVVSANDDDDDNGEDGGDADLHAVHRIAPACALALGNFSETPLLSPFARDVFTSLAASLVCRWRLQAREGRPHRQERG